MEKIIITFRNEKDNELINGVTNIFFNTGMLYVVNTTSVFEYDIDDIQSFTYVK